jgi:Transposase DDE domain group 1
MEQGINIRFVVSTKNGGPKDLYQLALNAGRLSCHRFDANQFRLLLHAAAYWLLDALRKKLVASGARRMQLDPLRLRLIKIGGRIRELLTRIHLYLASAHPGQSLRLAFSGPFGGVHA